MDRRPYAVRYAVWRCLCELKGALLMSWYWIVLIGLAAFALGFTVALFWLREVVRHIRRKQLDFTGTSTYTQMNPYL